MAVIRRVVPYAAGLVAPHVVRGHGGVVRLESSLVAIYIEKLGLGALLRSPRLHALASQELADLRLRIVHVAADDRVLRAYPHAGRLEPHVDPV